MSLAAVTALPGRWPAMAVLVGDVAEQVAHDIDRDHAFSYAYGER
jgi:hypothetical protein